MNLKINPIFLPALLLMTFLTACVPLPKAPPVAENFVFTPPNTMAASKSGMSIAILKPLSGGSMFVSDSLFSPASNVTMTRMLTATQTDIEKIIIARGFTTAGAYPTIDEMTFSQKERAALILRPTMNVDIVAAGAQATVSGNLVIELLEPMSREKVWIKSLELAPITDNIEYDLVQKQTTQGPQYVRLISPNSVTKLLNAFYQPTLQKIYNQLDTKEIQGLKSDTDKLKGKTQYHGGR